MRRPKTVYISTPLKTEKFRLQDIQTMILREKVFAFIPPSEEKNDRLTGAALDKLQIELCEEMWVFGPIGRDCSWEVGYAQGLGIPVRFFASEDNQHILSDDWMIFSAGTTIETVTDGTEKQKALCSLVLGVPEVPPVPEKV